MEGLQWISDGGKEVWARPLSSDKDAPPPPSYADIMFADGVDGSGFVKPGNCVNDYPICSCRGEGVRQFEVGA